MSHTANSYEEARALARRLRRAFVGTDWSVVIHRPLFPGDLFRVVVG